MFPRFASFVSSTVGYIIIAAAALMYMNQFIQSSINEVFTVGLSAFALVAALSGLCYALAPCLTIDEEKKTPLYAGEKFFHSCLLLLQTIFLKYVSISVLEIKWIQEHSSINYSVSIVFNILLVLISLIATYFCLFGFEAINDFLWKRYEVRWREARQKVDPKHSRAQQRTHNTQINGTENKHN
jgi:hypothetical protein